MFLGVACQYTIGIHYKALCIRLVRDLAIKYKDNCIYSHLPSNSSLHKQFHEENTVSNINTTI